MANTIDLNGRSAVVTGGAQGIGRAIVERLLESGAAVAIWDRDGALAERDRGELGGAAGSRPRRSTCDVTRLTEIEAARDATVKALGRIDILVNNAGIAGPERDDLGVSDRRLARGDARQSRQPVLSAAAPSCR